jgi:hypothetical protein
MPVFAPHLLSQDDPDALHQCMSATSGAMSQPSTQTPTRSSKSSKSSHSSAAHTSSAPSSSSSSSSSSHLESLLIAERAEHARALAAQKQRTTELAQQAYQRGVAEASVAHRDELRRTREAAELTHDLDLHDRELMRAAALQSTIERMKVPVTARPTLAPVACAQQRLAVQQCLRPNGAAGKPVADPLACAAIVRAYMECATVTVANSVCVCVCGGAESFGML